MTTREVQYILTKSPAFLVSLLSGNSPLTIQKKILKLNLRRATCTKAWYYTLLSHICIFLEYDRATLITEMKTEVFQKPEASSDIVKIHC